MARRMAFILGHRQVGRTTLILFKSVPPPIRGPWTLRGVVAADSELRPASPPRRGATVARG